MSPDKDLTKIIQVANIAPQTTLEHMQNIFSYVGSVNEIRLYPTICSDIGMQVTSKICFIKFHDSKSVSKAQHLTNTVFIDRALVVIPYMESEIPDESKGVELLRSGTMLPGIADPKLPQHVTSQLEGFPPHQVVATYDPKIAEAGLPMYPPLPNNYDTRKIEEIRRTVLVANIDKELSPEQIIDYFNQNCKEVKYFRLCTRDNDPLHYALIEFTEQPSVLEALKQNGMKLGSNIIKVFHAIQAIVKPQAKTNESAQKEIEEAMSRQAHTLLSKGINVSGTGTLTHLGAPVIKSKRRSRSRSWSRDIHSGPRRRRRSSSSRRRSRSRSKVSRRRSKSRESYRHRRRSTSRSKRSRSRSSKREDKKSSRKSKDGDKDEKRDRDRDRKDKDRKRDGDKNEKKDKDRNSKKDKEKDKGKSKEREERKSKKEISVNGKEH